MLLQLLRGNNDILEFLKQFLISVPGFIIALSFHEAAHAYVALKCGDRTALYLGRLTLNPLKHLDLRGLLCMLVCGVGWAKPVPVNPNNYQNPRRDDLKVSIAGIIMNLILFLISSLVMYAMTTVALRKGYYSNADWKVAYCYIYAMGDMLIRPELGNTAYYSFEFFCQLATVDMALAIFNLLPFPPLDGYHLFNDIILRGKNLFASKRVQEIASVAVLLLVVTGVFSKVYSFVITWAFKGMGSLFYYISNMLQAG